MAEAVEEKLVLKPGVISQYLTNFSFAPDGESMQFTDLNLENKRIEQLAKAMEEVKDVKWINLSINNL